jgi:hypothetical protein
LEQEADQSDHVKTLLDPLAVTTLLPNDDVQFFDFFVFLIITCGKDWEAMLIEILFQVGNDFFLNLRRGFNIIVIRFLLYRFGRVNDGTILNCAFSWLSSLVLRHLLSYVI